MMPEFIKGEFSVKWDEEGGRVVRLRTMSGQTDKPIKKQSAYGFIRMR